VAARQAVVNTKMGEHTIALKAHTLASPVKPFLTSNRILELDRTVAQRDRRDPSGTFR
jgi:hypothetical protein